MYKTIVETYKDLWAVHKDVVDVDMQGELPEQEMIFDHLNRDSTGVLEFGGNIGRSSIVINKLLRHPERHVVFESDPDNAAILKRNRDKNQCRFQIVSAALSDKPMIQVDWQTRHDENHQQSAPPGGKRIPTISFAEFRKRYPLKFDTLVIDCEGCIVPILKEHGDDLLSTISTIIIEHDDRFNPHIEQDYARSYLLSKGFTSVECRSDCFYEILERTKR